MIRRQIQGKFSRHSMLTLVGVGVLTAMALAGAATTQPATAPATTSAPADEAEASRIVFICDASGGMFDGRKMALQMRELQRILAKLKPEQAFDVIFFREGDRPVNESVIAVDKKQLLPATPGNLKKTSDFLRNIVVSGKTRPTPAIDLAFKLKPQLIYFMSDGEFDDGAMESYDDVVRRFRTANADGKVRVNTFIVGSQRAPSVELRKAHDAMQTIAKENGGTLGTVDPDAVLGQN